MTIITSNSTDVHFSKNGCRAWIIFEASVIEATIFSVELVLVIRGMRHSLDIKLFYLRMHYSLCSIQQKQDRPLHTIRPISCGGRLYVDVDREDCPAIRIHGTMFNYYCSFHFSGFLVCIIVSLHFLLLN